MKSMKQALESTCAVPVSNLCLFSHSSGFRCFFLGNFHYRIDECTVNDQTGTKHDEVKKMRGGEILTLGDEVSNGGMVAISRNETLKLDVS